MELVLIAKALWRKKLWVALIAVLAVLAAGKMVYGKTVTAGAATTEVLIDAPQSALGDLKRDVIPLTQRGGIFERFLATDEATNAIGKESGLPPNQIRVVPPKLNIDGVPDQKSAERASKIGGPRKYEIQVQQGDDLPVLSIVTSAPTKEDARKLANGAATALKDVVERLQDETEVPEKRRLTIRQLGAAQAGEVVESPSKVMAFAVFLFVMGAGCFVILAAPAAVEAWRNSEPRKPLAPVSANGNSSHHLFDAAAEGGENKVEAMYAAASVPAKGTKPKRGRRTSKTAPATPADDDSVSSEAERLLGL